MKNLLLITFVLIRFCAPGFSQETEQKFKERLLTVISPECEIASYKLMDLNNDEVDEFLVIGKEGQVKTWSYNFDKAGFEEATNNWNLPFPNQSLLSLSSFFVNDKTMYLVALTPEGLIAYPNNQEGSIESDGILINRRIKFQFRMNQPVFSDFLQDINQDGRLDVIVPIVNYCEVWINEGFKDEDSSSNGIPTFSKIGKFPVEMVHSRQTDLQNTRGLLSEQFSIPSLLLKDINGDKCLDLVVSHKPKYDYYILDKDSDIPEKPTVSLDLSLFQDTTPKAEGLQFGETISINQEPQLIESDLNNDHIPDYIISHMRKFWIFHGTGEGPQFSNPSSIIKIAEDITLMQPCFLDEDDYPDLLMLKIQIPTLSTLLRGLFTDWEIKMESIGYKSVQGESFELSSNWKGEIFLQLPSILSIVINPDEIKEKFNIDQKYGQPIYGDFNGDSCWDVAMSNKKNNHFEMWFTREKSRDGAVTNQDSKKELSSKIRKLLFTENNNVWDIDRIIKSVNALINEQVYIVTGGKDPDFYMAQFKDKTGFEVLSVDFDHDKKNELLFISSVPQSENFRKFELYTITNK